MTTEEMLGKPLFQLNLLLFLTMEVPPSAGINPIFAIAGYELVAIEPSLYAPRSAVLKLNEVGTDISNDANPEVVLSHDGSKSYVPVECKASSFGPDSSSYAKQATKFLLMTGPVLGEQLGESDGQRWTSILAYLTREGQDTRMLETLTELATRLRGYDLSPTSHAVLGLSQYNGGVYLRSVPQSSILPELDLETGAQVLRISPHDTPSVLYLIPYMSASPHERDEVAEQAFQEKLRWTIMTLFGKIHDEEQHYSIDEVIEQVVPTWPLWKNARSRNHFKVYVRQFLRETFQRLNRFANVRCSVSLTDIIVPPTSSAVRKKIRRFFVSASYRQLEMPLFDYAQIMMDDQLPPE